MSREGLGTGGESGREIQGESVVGSKSKSSVQKKNGIAVPEIPMWSPTIVLIELSQVYLHSSGWDVDRS